MLEHSPATECIDRIDSLECGPGANCHFPFIHSVVVVVEAWRINRL